MHGYALLLSTGLRPCGGPVVGLSLGGQGVFVRGHIHGANYPQDSQHSHLTLAPPPPGPMALALPDLVSQRAKPHPTPPHPTPPSFDLEGGLAFDGIKIRNQSD